MKRSLPLYGLVLFMGVALLGWGTLGFRVVTSEGARRLEVQAAPREIPQVGLVDHEGRPFQWEDVRGERVLVEFIFTTCPDVCQKMTSDFARLGAAGESGPRRVSVTFDPDNDTVARLKAVASTYGADGERWRFARIEDRDELARTLDAFGIVAVQAPNIGFEHNAAIHGLDREGRLARIDDIASIESIAQWASPHSD